MSDKKTATAVNKAVTAFTRVWILAEITQRCIETPWYGVATLILFALFIWAFWSK